MMIDSRTVGAVMVVGGGISGIQASLDLADIGFKVYLVEKAPSIGGHMAQLDKTFPTNDCSMCILSPKFMECARHPNISVLAHTDILRVDGKPGDFKVTILRKPRFVEEDKCIGCGTCSSYCPKLKTDAFNEKISTIKSIHVPFPQAYPAKALVDPDNCLFLQRKSCKICAPVCKRQAIDLYQQEKEEEITVGSLILATGYQPFDPTIRKGEYGYGRMKNVVTSLEFERIVCASGPFQGRILRPSDGKHPARVAWIQCIGSRDRTCGRDYCSSVCCMYATKQAILAKEHDANVQVTIFQNDVRTHGKGFERYYQSASNNHDIRYVRGIPSETKESPQSHNLVLKYAGKEGGMVEEEFDMVVLSVGLEPSPGTRDLAGILGIDLDKSGFSLAKDSEPLTTSREGIFVCGVIDAPRDIPESVQNASAAAFLAAMPIMESRETLTSEKTYPPEREVTAEDPRIGVFVCRCGTNIARVLNVPALADYAMTLPHVVHAEESMYACSIDMQPKITEAIEKYKLNRVVVAACTPRTHAPLFQETLREAGLSPSLFEMANVREHCSWVHAREKVAANHKGQDLLRMAVAKSRLMQPLPRSTISLKHSALVIGGGISGMVSALSLSEMGLETVLIERQVELGGNLRNLHFTLEGTDPQALLARLRDQVERSPKITVFTGAELKAVSGYCGNYKSTISIGDEEVNYEHGVVVVATGGMEYTPKGEYLFGWADGVITQSKFEELLIKDKKAISQMKSVVMIQCVGSREDPHMYCSRICCSQAVKNAIRLKDANPEAEIYVLYRDIRTYGMKELAYREAREKGVGFIRFDADRKPEIIQEEDKLKVRVFDSVLGQDILIDADLIVLSVAIRPQADAAELAQKLKVPLNEDGFFLEAHMKLRPVDFSNDGVFMCGLAHYPKTIDESVNQARAAAVRAARVLFKRELEMGGEVVFIDREKCNGCGVCTLVCRFDALAIDSSKEVVEANQILCKGCGACAAACPSGACSIGNLADHHIIAQMEALV